MKKNEMVDTLIQMAKEITGKNSDKWTWDKAREISDLCNDWNAEHEDVDEAGNYVCHEEIFMCDYQSDDSEYVNGFMIEDDYFIVEA